MTLIDIKKGSRIGLTTTIGGCVEQTSGEVKSVGSNGVVVRVDRYNGMQIPPRQEIFPAIVTDANTATVITPQIRGYLCIDIQVLK